VSIVRSEIVVEMLVRGVRIPVELWAKYIDHADRLLYRSPGQLVREALEYYEKHFLASMDRVFPEVVL
jgi:hypothetical protein